MVFETLEQVRDYLTQYGFKEYRPTPFTDKGVITCFQKRYDDELGKKYFLDCNVWDWTWTERIEENYSLEFGGQLYQKDTHDAMDYTFIGWELEQSEKFLEDLFTTGLFEHYESWENS